MQAKVLNTKHHGLPHNRKRIYVVATRKDKRKHVMKWPENIPASSRLDIDELLDPHDGRDLASARWAHSLVAYIDATSMRVACSLLGMSVHAESLQVMHN